MQTSVCLPRLLDGNLRESARLRPTALSLAIERRSASTAQLTLPEDEPVLAPLSFIELYTARGSADIFRVDGDQNPVQGTRTYSLKHAVSTLHDSLWREQGDFEGTVSQFLQKLLSFQVTPRWRLGRCEDAGSWNKTGLNYDRLDDLLFEIAEDRNGYLFTYDFSTAPWTLNFVAASGTVDAEMRLTRNLSDGNIRRSREGMVNRLHLSIRSLPADDGSTTVSYATYNNTESQSLYGILEGTASIDLSEEPSPAAWAARYLADHAGPSTQASADGYEIVKSSGEGWDQFDVGKLCRLAARREGYPAALPIERVQFENLMGQSPEKARIELNRKLPKISERLATAQTTAERAYSGSRANARAIQETETHFTHEVKETNESLSDCFHVVGVKIDPATGMAMRDANGNYVWAGPGDAIAEIWGHFHRSAWNTVIANMEQDGGGNVLSIGQVSTEADGQVFIRAINDQRTGTAAINADRIKLTTTGGTTVTLDDKFEIDTDGYINLKGTTIVQGNLNLTQNYSVSARNYVVGTGGYIRLVGANSGEYYDLSTSNVPECIRDLQFVVDPNNAGHYILQKKTIYNSATWTYAANFNIAATQYFQDSVAAAKSSVTAGIVDGNNGAVSGQRTLSAGDSITLYPARYISGTFADKNTNAAVIVTAESGGSADASYIDIANASDIFDGGTGSRAPSTYNGNPVVYLGNLSDRIRSNPSGSYVIFRGTINPPGSATAGYKYYCIQCP